MKRFFCAAFFIAVITLLAACGALNTTTATPTSSTSRAQKTPSTVKVNETAAKVEVVTAQSSATPESTTSAAAETPATGDFPVMYLVGVVGLILICSAGLLMLRKI